MASWHNGKLAKWQVDQMTSWPIGKLTNWQVDKMASWLNGKLTKWQVDQMASWQNVKLTNWQVDQLASWQNGKLTKWQVDKKTLRFSSFRRLSSIHQNQNLSLKKTNVHVIKYFSQSLMLPINKLECFMRCPMNWTLFNLLLILFMKSKYVSISEENWQKTYKTFFPIEAPDNKLECFPLLVELST